MMNVNRIQVKEIYVNDTLEVEGITYNRVAAMVVEGGRWYWLNDNLLFWRPDAGNCGAREPRTYISRHTQPNFFTKVTGRFFSGVVANAPDRVAEEIS